MPKARHYKLPLLLQIVLIAIFLGGGLVVFNSFRIKLVPFFDRMQMEERTGLNLVTAIDPVGYFLKAAGGYSWINFKMEFLGLKDFAQQNGLKERLSAENIIIRDALIKNRGIETMKHSKVKNWISEGFIPTLAFNGERISVLVGKQSQESSTLTVYICKF